ncbi:MAG: iron-sulfur cluster carrier protein ApbC [Alistipes senegalensis]|nr:iron-sulfur cluster carrier protein ApbC [Oxalobacter formigenes]MCM1281340.1 iron-sulfur cluster carrier protein ApbC [Alistipes senegalensis]
MDITTEAVSRVLSTVVDGDTGLDWISSRSVKQIHAEGNHVSVLIGLPYPAKSRWEAVRAQITGALRNLPGVGDIRVEVTSDIRAHAVQGVLKPLPAVKNMIAVASGKGGVGKSTVAANLALALSAEGAAVGILDADVHGPSLPILFGETARPQSTDGKTFDPLEKYGIQFMSVGLMIDPEEPVIWRAPVATQTLLQLLEKTNWRGLDYLILDLPPGTGDIPLTLAQRVPLTGAVIVTTPQDVALSDAQKGLAMFEKLRIPVLGIVENMSLHICSCCGHAEPVFGEGGAEKLGIRHGVDVLGRLPLRMSVCEQGDEGTPPVVVEPDGAVSRVFLQIARRLGMKISQLPKDGKGKFPGIAVERG